MDFDCSNIKAGPGEPREEDESSHFLSLPPEIRCFIYEELLVPPKGTRLLYGSSFGQRGHLRDRKDDFPLYSQILRVNRQINTEATSFLYERTCWSIDISGSATTLDDNEFGDVYGPPETLLCLDTSGGHLQGFKHPGLVYPHCFQRLNSIEISTSPEAVWEYSKGAYYLSPMGKLLLQLLRLLADDANPESSGKRKRLQITVWKEFCVGGDNLVLFPREAESEWKFNFIGDPSGEEMQLEGQVCPLVEVIRTKRDISIIEYRDNTDIYGPESLERRQVTLEDFKDL